MEQERKIIQIAYGQSSTENNDDYTLIALCNDGTTWWISPFGAAPQEWVLIKPIPQPK